jgi:conjugative transposon TraK protein
MFERAKNIDQAFRQTRSFALVAVGCVTVLALVVCWKSYQMVAAREARIYLLAGGKALEALSADRRENLGVEARDHVKTFHQYFFTLSPDDRQIQETITKALYLADASARKVYESLRENNYYTGLIAGNVSQTIQVDSVQVDTRAWPYPFRCFARQTITRPSSITTRSLLTEGVLRPVARSDNNPHGFLIERWMTRENKDLKTEKR